MPYFRGQLYLKLRSQWSGLGIVSLTCCGMGLFDFLQRWTKPKPAFQASSTLDELLMLAGHDPAYWPEFYRRMLVEQLVVLTGQTPHEVAEQQANHEVEQPPLKVLVQADGTVPIFTSPDRIFDQGGTHKVVAFTQMNGRRLLEHLHGIPLVLNPYSPLHRKLSAVEVDQILSGTFSNLPIH